MTVIVEVPAPGAGIEAGLKLTVTPEGCPEALSEIAESNTVDTMVVMVKVVEDPGGILTDFGAVVIEKLGMATVSDTLVV